MKKEFVGKEALERLISLIKTNKQDKTDKGLKTKDKTIVGAINEVNNKAGQGGGLTEEQVKAVVRETAVTQETDPTVPAWAKQAKKPTYSYEEIKDKPALFSGNYNDLSNKPDLFSGDYNDLSNKPTIPSTEGLATVEQLENLGAYADEINDKLNGTNDLVDSFNQDLSDLTNKTDELEEYSIRDVSLGILEDNELSVELKDKEGNIVASAETTLPMPDLTDYVKNTDRNQFVKDGVVANNISLTDVEKASACEWLGAMPIVKPPAAYWTYFLTIGKDESGKIEYDLRDFNELANKEYVDNLVGDIESVLTAILGV